MVEHKQIAEKRSILHRDQDRHHLGCWTLSGGLDAQGQLPCLYRHTFQLLSGLKMARGAQAGQLGSQKVAKDQEQPA
jgi:hypothetical protein